jgi:serine protease inhibitor
MQPEPVPTTPTTSNRRRKFFLLGALFELLLITLCYVLPESWLSVEARNFAVITHFPLMLLTEIMRVGDGPVAVVLFLCFGLAVMASVWGILIFLVTKCVGWVMARQNQKQKVAIKFLGGAGGLALLAWAIVSMLPETPRAFESSPEIKSVVEANNAFALDLYQKLKDKPGNLFFSPYIVSASLAMASVGARGQTEMEMTNALHFSLPPEKLHPAFKALAGRMDNIQRWNRIVLKSASSLWCQNGHSFTEPFLKLVRENYFGEARVLDFKSPGAADEINNWIETQTHHRIKGGIVPEQITPDLGLVLCDAIYFKGKWLHPFKEKDTRPSEFHPATNETVTVPMMWQSGHFKHAMTEDYAVEMVELPYSGQDLSMVILLPGDTRYVSDAEHNDVHDLEQKLTAENLRAWLKKLDDKNPHKTSVHFPRFTTSSKFNFADELKTLGMKSAFGGAADFSGMDGTTNLFLSEVFHRAFVEVNESGTEATAVNLALARTKGMDDRFNVDHPFIFLIRENGSGSILFLGRIIDPTK